CEAGARLLRVAETLAPRQTAALELVRQYTEVPAVGPDDVAEAEYEVSVAQLSLKRPKITDTEKKQLSRHLATLEKKVQT
ncbi:hypothetical protein KIPB_017142, partial [Kipferlia bialata]